jgi:hypothetical protein
LDVRGREAVLGVALLPSGRGSSREGRTEDVGVERGEVMDGMEGDVIRGVGAGEAARGEVIVAIVRQRASLVSAAIPSDAFDAS